MPKTMTKAQIHKVNWLAKQRMERIKLKDLRVRMEKRMHYEKQAKKLLQYFG